MSASLSGPWEMGEPLKEKRGSRAQSLPTTTGGTEALPPHPRRTKVGMKDARDQLRNTTQAANEIPSKKSQCYFKLPGVAKV